MDELYRALEELTGQFVQRIHSVTYVEVEQFVEHRGHIIEQLLSLKPVDFSMEQRHKAAQARLQQFEGMIMNKIADLRDEASQQLIRMQNGNVQRSGYDMDVTPDSQFFDRRK